MRLSSTMIVLFVLIALATTAVAAPPTTVSYQGRLTTSAGAPVPNGTYSVRFSLWSDLTLGTESWSETQMVSVTDGLFSTELGSISGGFFDISVCPPYCDAYLQIEVTIGGGVVTISPRSHLSASPWSLVSRSLYSENTAGSARARGIITKKPGGGANGMHVLLDTDSDGDGMSNTTSEMESNSDSASLRLNGLPPGIPVEGTLSMSASGSGARSTWKGGMSGSTTGTIRMAASPDSAVSVLEHDSDGDGLPETSDRRTVSSNDVHHNSIARGGSTTGTIRMQTTPDSSVSVFGQDSDGDGIQDASVKLASGASMLGGALPGGAVLSARSDVDDDGTPDNTIDIVVTPTTSSVAINKKGTGADKGRSIGSTTYPDSAVHVVSSDEDGDGFKDMSIETKLKNLGLLEPSAVHRMIMDSDDDGTPDNSIEQSITPTKSALAIKTKGTSAQRQSIGLDSESDSAGLVVGTDSDGDGIAEARGIVTTKLGLGGNEPLGRMATNYDTDDDGIPDNTAEMSVTPTKSALAIKTKGTGAQRLSAGGDCDDADASLHTGYDTDGDGVADGSVVHKSSAGGSGSIIRGGMSGSTTATIRMQATPDSTVFDLGYSGSTTGTIRMKAGSAGTANPIEHSSGAVLTVGGVWTNASDERLKENFEQVDGAEILEKIEDLPISEWNYKSEGDDAKHIGPTAQDFSDAFGLGGSDKTISTIDPSGVALVAIKELTKQNKELKKKNSELENKLNDLQTQVEKLASSMKK